MGPGEFIPDPQRMHTTLKVESTSDFQTILWPITLHKNRLKKVIAKNYRLGSNLTSSGYGCCVYRTLLTPSYARSCSSKSLNRMGGLLLDFSSRPRIAPGMMPRFTSVTVTYPT